MVGVAVFAGDSCQLVGLWHDTGYLGIQKLLTSSAHYSGLADPEVPSNIVSGLRVLYRTRNRVIRCVVKAKGRSDKVCCTGQGTE